MRSNFIVKICDLRRKIEIIPFENLQKILRCLRIYEIYYTNKRNLK
nr:MAG TPA: hypothetical protein [Caudoviricetes sp.]